MDPEDRLEASCLHESIPTHCEGRGTVEGCDTWLTRDTCLGCQETEIITWGISKHRMEGCWDPRDRLARKEWEGNHTESQRGKIDVTSCHCFLVQS